MKKERTMTEIKLKHRSLSDRVMYLATELKLSNVQVSAFTLVAQDIDVLVGALEEAVKLVELWNKMDVHEQVADRAWIGYRDKSPEMQRILKTLAAAKGESTDGI